MNSVESNVKRSYETPSIKKLTVQQARSFLVEHAKEFLELILPNRTAGETDAQPVQRYEAPRLTRLSPEQAKLKLLGHISDGDAGASELLCLFFPDPAGRIR